MSLDEFLSAHGLTVNGIVSHVDSVVGLGPHDCLMLVGSLAEGIANSKSDLDLWLVIAPREDDHRESRDVACAIGGLVVDMKVIPAAELDLLVDSLDSWNQSHWNITQQAGISYEDRILLHRLHHARSLAGEITGLVKPVDKYALSRLKHTVARQEARTVQVDLAGHQIDGNYRSMVFASQNLLSLSIDSLLAEFQQTNPLPKWRSKLLEFIPSTWENSFPIRSSGLSANERFWRLHRAPEQPQEHPCRDHAFRIAAFARSIFAATELHFLGSKFAWSGQSSLSSQKRSSSHPSLPFLDLDVDFAFIEGAFHLRRLNHPGKSLRLSPKEFYCCMLFDGITTISEADTVLHPTRSGAGEELVCRLGGHGLLAMVDSIYL